MLSVYKVKNVILVQTVQIGQQCWEFPVAMYQGVVQEGLFSSWFPDSPVHNTKFDLQ